jgi:hypothetical protein
VTAQELENFRVDETKNNPKDSRRLDRMPLLSLRPPKKYRLFIHSSFLPDRRRSAATNLTRLFTYIIYIASSSRSRTHLFSQTALTGVGFVFCFSHWMR